MQGTASCERPETTSHAEFVQGYRGGRIALTWADGLPAYTFAAWGRWFIGYLQLLVGFRSIFVLFVILTFVLRDPWLLLGIPVAYLGTAAGAPGHDARKSPARVFMTVAAFFGLFFGLFSDQGWGSAVLLISCGFLVPFAVNLTYHTICQRAFVRLLLTEKEFYEAVLERNVITLRTSTLEAWRPVHAVGDRPAAPRKLDRPHSCRCAGLTSLTCILNRVESRAPLP